MEIRKFKNTDCQKPSHFMMSPKSPCKKEKETILRKPVRHADELEINLSHDRIKSVFYSNPTSPGTVNWKHL